MAIEPTARDALIAEMLGDVGKLHDELQSLKESLPAFASDVETKLSGILNSVVQASNRLRADTETHVTAAKNDATKSIEAKAHQIAAWYAAEIGKAATTATSEHVGIVVERATKQLDEAVTNVRSASEQIRRSAAQKMLVVIGCSALAGAAGGIATQLLGLWLH